MRAPRCAFGDWGRCQNAAVRVVVMGEPGSRHGVCDQHLATSRDSLTRWAKRRLALRRGQRRRWDAPVTFPAELVPALDAITLALLPPIHWRADECHTPVLTRTE